MRTFIINFKNYQEILGERALALAKAAETVGKRIEVELVLAPPQPLVGLMAERTSLPVFSQSVSDGATGATTGLVVPEAVIASGAVGTLLNHSEARLEKTGIERLLPRLRELGLKVCLCANSEAEAQELARFGSEYLAVEPPELIGSGIAVSKARPEVISESILRTRRAGYQGKVLCGAGIVEGKDVEAAVKLGSAGILVASGVVKARNWEEKIAELAAPLV